MQPASGAGGRTDVTNRFDAHVFDSSLDPSVPDLQQAAGRSAFLQHGVCSARSSLKRWSLKRCSLNHLCEAEDGKRLDQRPQCAGEREGAARALSGRIGPSSTALMALSPAAPTFWVRNGARQRCTARCKRSEEEQARPADLRGGLCRVQVRAHHDAAFKFHMKRRADDERCHNLTLRLFNLTPKAFQWGCTYLVERGTRPGLNAALAWSAGALII